MTAATGMDLRQALDRSAAFFRDRETRCGVLARRVLGQPRRTDAALAEYLVRVRRCKTRMDGSAEGSFVRTAWTAWELLDLDCSADHAGVVRTLGYVIGRQNAPGHFAEGCDPTRHERRLCCHFLRGFFSPGPRDELLAPLTLPNGVTVDDEERARFGASCLALRVVLRAGEDRRPAVREHIDCLLGLARLWNEQETEWSPALASFALGGLALAPFEYRQGVTELAETVARRQDADGTWPEVDLFQAVEALLPVTGSGRQHVDPAGGGTSVPDPARHRRVRRPGARGAHADRFAGAGPGDPRRGHSSSWSAARTIHHPPTAILATAVTAATRRARRTEVDARRIAAAARAAYSPIARIVPTPNAAR